MKLKLTFSLWTILLISLSILGVSLTFFLIEKNFLSTVHRNHQISLLRQLAHACQEAYLINDHILILNYIKKIKTQEGVVWGSFSNTQNKIIAHSQAEKIGQYLSRKNVLKTRTFKPGKISSYRDSVSDIFSLPVYDNNNYLGLVTLAFSHQVFINKINANLTRIGKTLLIVSWLMLLLGIGGTFLLSKVAFHPIDLLVTAVNQLGQGNLNTRILSKRKDELGTLIQAFNDMGQKLKELDEMKEDFLSQITHELRSPLGEIQTYIHLMTDASDKELLAKREKNLGYMQKSASRLAAFIDNLLDVAKMERGKLVLHPESISSRGLIEEVGDAYQAQAKNKDVELQLSYPKQDIVFTGDQDKLRQVLSNLVSNAIKFTPAGGIIELGVKFVKNDPTAILFWVKDSGIGIPESDYEHIFDKFYQVRRDKKALFQKIGRIKGTGLGLAIAKKIIEAHNGKLWVESQIEQGSIFQILLPLQ